MHVVYINDTAAFFARDMQRAKDEAAAWRAFYPKANVFVLPSHQRTEG